MSKKIKKKKIGYAVVGVNASKDAELEIVNNKIHRSRQSAQNAINCLGGQYALEIRKVYIEMFQ